MSQMHASRGMRPTHATAPRAPRASPLSQRGPLKVNALFNFGKKPATTAEPPATEVKGSKGKQAAAKPASSRKEESQVTKVLNAFDFSQARSSKDADLLYEAKYGKSKSGEKFKMTPEQAAALRRKVGGTAKDYFKTWIEDEQPKNIKPYEKPADGLAGAKVPYLPFLIGVLVSMFVVTAVVVQKTSH